MVQMTARVYFEEDDFDGFLAHLVGCADVVYVRLPLEHRWGQRGGAAL